MPPRRKRPPTNENEPSSSFSTSSIAQPRITRSKSARQPPNLKPLQPSSTVVSSIASVEEEEEDIEEIQSTSSGEEEQQRFQRVGEVDSAGSVVSVVMEGERAIGGEESDDAVSTASRMDDGSVDSEGQDEEEYACFLEEPVEMMPNKLFVSEKASLLEEVRSGWFKIDKQLGKGAFGVVFRAHHVDTPSRVYAIKVIKAATKEERAGVKRELYAQRDCDGNFTLPILGATTLSNPLGSACIIMPVAVGSLAELLQHRDGLKSSNRNKALLEYLQSLSLRWFGDICDGMAHVHDQGYAHRDLKPENIFFLARDGVLVPQIGDFGCARLVEDGQDYG
ncbi:kinase-like domain-containing protein [Leucosporidium creatinivorum]|uniref:Kinase-like domain-containing protein n=1 Tax=Leucosporidium creatinivorum TaxID=106004 RepID=A0A1Y2D4R9_9BASI|nr:kinase-like domain-containing protein [Leucosporidium creatinivorum]